MGYTTEFKGLGFWTDRPLSEEHRAYIVKFADRRHMQVNPDLIKAGPTRTAAGMEAGKHGEFVLDDDTHANGTLSEDSGWVMKSTHPYLIDYNAPPHGVPGLWCQWTVDEDGHITWDGNEKFYHYDEWLSWLIENILRPWGYVLNGTLDYQGEDDDDFGRLIVVDNVVTNVFQWKGGE